MLKPRRTALKGIKRKDKKQQPPPQQQQQKVFKKKNCLIGHIYKTN